MPQIQIELGSTVKHRVHGFTGIATARCVYITKCVHIEIQPKVGKDGKLPESRWCDEDQLDVLKLPVKKKAKGRKGGPASTPSERSHPA